MKSVANLKRILCTSSLVLAVVFSPLTSKALTVQEVPNPQQVSGGWVTDMAGILKPETESQINQIITQLEAKNGAEMAVVTVPETAPTESPKEFTTKLFNYWGIGKKGQDNGVLFLVSVKDRRVEIETGYGVEGILTDSSEPSGRGGNRRYSSGHSGGYSGGGGHSSGGGGGSFGGGSSGGGGGGGSW